MDSATLAKRIAEYDNNAVTTASAMNEALGKYGVPEIRNNVSGLRTTVANTTNALNNVDPSVTGRTQGSLVTEAQRQKQVSNERAPIAQQLSSQGGQLGDQERILNEAITQATGEANARVGDYQTGRAALQSQYDMTYRSEQDRAEAARQDAALKEQMRQFNVSSSISASKGGGSSKKATAAETKQANAQAITSNLAKASGKDGFVSRASFGAALNDFQAAGLGDTRKFWQMYGRYVNPKTKSQYPGFNQR